MIDAGHQKDYSCLTGMSTSTLNFLQASLRAYLQQDQLQDYRPTAKQAEFHMAGRMYDNRLLRAGNQIGKTYSAAAECAAHLTGEYPDWWEGLRFDRPITVWAASETAESTRDNCQSALFGPVGQLGVGMIPKRCITGIYGMASGVKGAFEFRYIRHVSGGMSLLRFRNYNQNRRAWQGPKVDLVWMDEEPPMDLYKEGLARTVSAQGVSMMTFTPLLGYTPVVNLYLRDPDPHNSGRHTTQMTLWDAGHMSEAQKKKQYAKWEKHDRRARVMGEPAIGVGQIYPYDTDEISIEPFAVPDHWPVICAIDVSGGSSSPSAHPTAAVKLVWDRDDDVVYVVQEYRKKGLKPPEHWMRLKWWGKDLRWAWPKDASAQEKGTGAQVIRMYREEGMKALPIHAQYPKRTRKGGSGSYQDNPGSTVSVERGLMDVGSRLEYGRMRVFSTCTQWFEEMRQYHRDEDNKIVKVMDDLMDATRYGIMMLRFAHLKKRDDYRPETEVDWQVGF